MIKKLGISAVATLMALSTFSITEAANSDDSSYCRRDGYCYNQNYNSDNGYCNDGYGCGNNGCSRGRGCW